MIAKFKSSQIKNTILHRIFSDKYDNALSGQNITLFGTGIVSQEISRALSNNGLEVESYVVTEKK